MRRSRFRRWICCCFLPGEIKTLNYLAAALGRQREALEAYIEADGYLVAIGTTGLLFGGETRREDGSVFAGLGLLDMRAEERKFVWGDDLHFRLRGSKQEILGSQIQMADIFTRQPLGDTLYGRGNCADGTEGARRRNLIFTNCLGPVFVKNPWWAEDILKDICLHKALGLTPGRETPLENASLDTCLRFLREKPKFPAK
jgi:CobQ-like glutamine amidotransferase family enzyme